MSSSSFLPTTAAIMGMKGAPSITVTYPGNVTNRHQHICAVLNLLSEGRKEWRVEAPGKIYKSGTWTESESAAGLMVASPKPEKRIVQEAGDLLYLPPGYHHQVTTLGSTRAVSLVTFWMPEECKAAALLNFLGGDVQENQVSSGGVNVRNSLDKSRRLLRALSGAI